LRADIVGEAELFADAVEQTAAHVAAGFIDEIEGMKKKDDVCDTILQVIAYVGRNLKQSDGGTAKLAKGGRRAGGGYEQDDLMN
jgi:hypothetical protein